MSRSRSPLDDFFDPSGADPVLAILAACRAVSTASEGEIRGHELCGRRWQQPRWRHVRAGAPLLHPRLLPRIAAALGLTERDVVAIWTMRSAFAPDGTIAPVGQPPDLATSGPFALQERLRQRRDTTLESAGWPIDALFVECVPIIPSTDDPPVAVPDPEPDRWSTKVAARGRRADTQAIEAFVGANHAVARRLELSRIPSDDVDRQELWIAYTLPEYLPALADAFDRLCNVLARGPDRPTPTQVPERAWTEPDRPREAPTLPGAPPVPDSPNTARPTDGRPVAVTWLGEDRVAIQLAAALFVVDLADGRVHGPRPLHGTRLVGASHGRLILVDDPSYSILLADTGDPADDTPTVGGVYVLDVDAPCWLAGALPPDLPSVFVTGDQPEDAWLVDVRDGRTARLPDDLGDRPHELARTPDHRHLWVGSDGAAGSIVVDTTTGWTRLELDAMRLDEQRAPRLGGGRRTTGVPREDAALAISRASDRRWRILDACAGVSDDGEVRFRLGSRPDAAAFDASGARLAVADAESLVIVDFDEARVHRRVDLRPLVGWVRSLGASAGRNAKQLLRWFATPEAIAAVADPALARLVTPSRVTRLRDAAAAAPPPPTRVDVGV